MLVLAMASTLPKIHALDKPAIPDTFGITNSPIGFFLAAWQGELLTRLTLLPSHHEKNVKQLIVNYHLPKTAAQDDARAKELVMTHLFPQNNWHGNAGHKLKLGFHGTSFQHNVMKHMLKIPHGKTASYGDLAAKAGSAGASRATGSVCAKNPLPFVVPCHRVLTGSGALGNYGFGTALKRQLLQWENALKSIATK